MHVPNERLCHLRRSLCKYSSQSISIQAQPKIHNNLAGTERKY